MDRPSAPPAAQVRFTANFEANLEDIARFWESRGAGVAYRNLLDHLAGTALPNLEQHPRIGRSFLARSGQSLEVRSRVADLTVRYGTPEVREYLASDYLMLYSVSSKPGMTVYLLAIRHHRQLSFDLDGFLNTP